MADDVYIGRTAPSKAGRLGGLRPMKAALLPQGKAGSAVETFEGGCVHPGVAGLLNAYDGIGLCLWPMGKEAGSVHGV